MVSLATRWIVSANGVDTQCSYSSDLPALDTCGPGGRFESSRTDVNGPANNSSLSVDLITNDLNGTTVSCGDGGTGELTGSYNICIIGNADYSMWLCIKCVVITANAFCLFIIMHLYTV